MSIVSLLASGIVGGGVFAGMQFTPFKRYAPFASIAAGLTAGQISQDIAAILSNAPVPVQAPMDNVIPEENPDIPPAPDVRILNPDEYFQRLASAIAEAGKSTEVVIDEIPFPDPEFEQVLEDSVEESEEPEVQDGNNEDVDSDDSDGPDDSGESEEIPEEPQETQPEEILEEPQEEIQEEQPEEPQEEVQEVSEPVVDETSAKSAIEEFADSFIDAVEECSSVDVEALLNMLRQPGTPIAASFPIFNVLDDSQRGDRRAHKNRDQNKRERAEAKFR